MWGDIFGACVDRYGVSWLVDIAAPTGSRPVPGPPGDLRSLS